MAAIRPKITDITLKLLMPDGTTVTKSINPDECDALVWSDRAVEVFAKFYDQGGPAFGKRMLQADLLQAFPGAEALIGANPDLEITPAVIDALWNTPKEAGGTLAPAYLSKSIMNPTNG